MLGYLDSLVTALNTRETREIERLLAHPLARILPSDARREAEAFREGTVDALSTPLRGMQLRHQTAELLRVSALPPALPMSAPPRVTLSASARATKPAPTELAQMELALSA